MPAIFFAAAKLSAFFSRSCAAVGDAARVPLDKLAATHKPANIAIPAVILIVIVIVIVIVSLLH